MTALYQNAETLPEGTGVKLLGLDADGNAVQVEGVEELLTASDAAVAAAAATAADVIDADAARVLAETARDAALAGGTIYPDIATGRAAVADNAYFKVIGSGAVSFRLYKRLTSSTQSLEMEQPSAAAVAALEAVSDVVVGSGANLFNPSTDVISGYMYDNAGAQATNASYRVTKKYTVSPGQAVSISGLGGLKAASFFNSMHFWNGSTLVSRVLLPASTVPTDYMVEVAPAGSTHFSLNLWTIGAPPSLQIELASAPSPYRPYGALRYGLQAGAFESEHYQISSKNLYDGSVQGLRYLFDTSIGISLLADDVITGFIPVENGVTYTISGLDPALVTVAANRRILGHSSDRNTGNFVKKIGTWSSSTFTFTVDDPLVKFIVIQISRSGQGGAAAAASALRLQVEKGGAATDYEPRRGVRGAQPAVNAARQEAKDYATTLMRRLITSRPVLTDMGGTTVAGMQAGAVSELTGPIGAAKRLGSTSLQDAVGANLYAAVRGLESGTRSLLADVANLAGGSTSTPIAGGLTVSRFSTPSGQLDNGDGPIANYAATNSTAAYIHPSIAYDAVGVAGFKYWMISSAYPGYSTDAEWEDEDIFVSNDAITWQRIRSLYESDKTYTTSELRLPPHNLATNGRRFAFLPCPGAGQTIEVSVPADNGAVALDRVSITLSGYPWKHDPAILIDGGFVYFYLSYHLSYAARPGGTNRFLVCVRTSDGINWEVVRSDGSTLALSSDADARQMFTKDESGRYNYINYAYNRSRSNPEVIKYGAGDYELVYGANFSTRFKGTEPWLFDFGESYPFQDLGSGNHPGLLLSSGSLYLLNSQGLFVSSNRGETFTALGHYPTWLGCASGLVYKHALCVGASGKVFIAQTRRVDMSAAARPPVSSFTATNPNNFMVLVSFPGVADFAAKGTNGLREGYVDIQVDQINEAAGTRKSFVFPYITSTAANTNPNNAHQRVKVADITVKTGDLFHVYVTLVARNGAFISLGGIEFA